MDAALGQNLEPILQIYNYNASVVAGWSVFIGERNYFFVFKKH
jgi:hypothetical protein